jgi:hypothetical protein
MKIHATLIMSIYQNSDMCIYIYIYQKIHSTNKINSFNYEDLNIFLKYYFLQLYCLIFYHFSIYIYILVHYNIYIYFLLFFLCRKNYMHITHTHSHSLTLITHGVLIITHTHMIMIISHIYTLYTLTHSGEDEDGEDADVWRLRRGRDADSVPERA